MLVSFAGANSIVYLMPYCLQTIQPINPSAFQNTMSRCNSMYQSISTRAHNVPTTSARQESWWSQMELEYLPQGNCDPRSPNVFSLVPLLRPDPEHMRFSCSRRTGAILSLPAPARRQDTLAEGDFSKWIVKNIDVWFAFARRLGFGITRMEDIVLVTGCHLARSWANIA